MKRFVDKCRKKNNEHGELTTKELDAAEIIVLKIVQTEVFPVPKAVISGIHVQNDENGLICVKTKLIFRDDTHYFRLPILLPNNHPLVELMIRNVHETNGHCGAQTLVGKLREKYWILQTRKAVRKVIHSCIKCRRFMAKAPESGPAALPNDRIKEAKVFQVVGVDLAGPLFLLDNTKVWIVLFTCAVYRCVHMELVSTLSTEGFMAALERFIHRRGRMETIYCDNGKNFVGTYNLLQDLDWKKIEMESHVKKIQWQFSPPAAPWWGGFWERLIRNMKDLLKRILGKNRVNYEEMLTCLCEVEAIMNGRPLTFVTEDSDDLIPLTPAMFLQDIEEVGTSDLEAANGQNMRRKYKSMKKLKQELRSRFRKEYLSLLVQKGKEKPSKTFKVGDVVLVEIENMKRIMWPMGRVLELIPGKDNNVRVVKVKTTTGVITRPIQRLIPLEISSSDQEIMKKPMEKDKNKMTTTVITKSGRVSKTPSRYGTIGSFFCIDTKESGSIE
jgi:hypothetical protein